jgi:hypothetical protein
MPVEKQPEPKDFFKKVQEPGEKFLVQNPHPKGNQWRGHEYWVEIIPDLYDAYSGICAYSCHWTPYDTGWKTVEHFKPKSKYPQEAYHWDNYRFVCGALNGCKGNHEDVLDPFTVKDGWFVIEFSSLQLKSGQGLSENEAKSVKSTIKRLKLNSEALIRGRRHWIIRYLRGYPFEYLAEHAPFLAKEMTRQNLVSREHPIWEELKIQTDVQ